MRTLRLFLPACLLLVGANIALAQGSTDPKIVMGGGGSCQSFDETSLTQTFTNVETGCVVDFTNQIKSGESEVPNVILDLLVVNVDTPFTGALSCALGAGAPLLGTPTVSSPTSCTFQDPPQEILSIDPGTTYSLSFVNPNAIGGGFPAFIDITLAQTVIPTPEPATILLLGVGVAVLFAGRKRLKVAGTGAN
ncbi:MAG: PEP-CTERM sorting domain-containing protein [Candidatus Acidiferrum sp.]